MELVIVVGGKNDDKLSDNTKHNVIGVMFPVLL